MFLFRPPYGDYDNAVVKTAKKCGYYTIQWDVDSLDWKDYGVDSIIKTVTEHKHLGNGSIILCHNHPSGNRHPSQADDRLTDKVHQATRIMDIKLHDHLIICEGTYYSYADEGRI